MNIRDLIGEATEYDKKLEVEIKKPKSWCKNVFNRLGYMERKGSGFGKIIGDYEFQINYDESKKPSFRSDRYQFTVIMPNLNYGLKQETDDIRVKNVDGAKDDTEKIEKQMALINLMQEDPYITQNRMAELLGLSRRTVQRLTETMITDHVISRVGSKRTGHWEIL